MQLFTPQDPRFSHQFQFVERSCQIKLAPAFSGQIYIWPHDNRIMVLPNQEATPTELEAACRYLKDNFGGKIFVCIPSALVGRLNLGVGFSDNLTSTNPHEGIKRIRAIETQRLKSLDLNQGLSSIEIITNETAARTTILERRRDILELMRQSGFLASKIADYQAKGAEGIGVLMLGSHPIVFQQGERIVGFCNLSTIGNIGYISDTLTPSDANKEFFTWLLYKKAAEVASTNGMREIVLIVPSDRVPEFESYGFANPNLAPGFSHIFASFTPPRLELRNAYEASLSVSAQANAEVAPLIATKP